MTIDGSDRPDARDDSSKEVREPPPPKIEGLAQTDATSTASSDSTSIEETLRAAGQIATDLGGVVDERTVTVRNEIDDDAFFSAADGATTVTNRYDLEKAVPLENKTRFREVDRYWVNEPYAFVSIFHSTTENEKKYFLVEPHLNDLEADVQEFLAEKLRRTIKYADEEVKQGTRRAERRDVIEAETGRLLERYDLHETPDVRNEDGLLEKIRTFFRGGRATRERRTDGVTDEPVGARELEGVRARPEPVVLAEDRETLTEYQIGKLRYHIDRDFVGYERIDGIKHDDNVEDISVDGYDAPVFVYHAEHEQLISNVRHGNDELDEFVVKLAQWSGNGISKRRPQVDATLPDGSRAQLTLGSEVSDHGTNYTIRQFTDVPFTPIDLINWNTYSLEEMAFLWLAIENGKSLLLAGGTASGKTTSLNAVSLFIPSSAKVVSIEDTREITLPQRNWIASTTRPSIAADSSGAIDEFDLLETSLRQRPDYLLMGEVRGEEGRTLFQVMSTGHTTCTTFHADSVDEVLKRFTTAPIDVSKTMVTALDLVSIQTETRVQGRTVRRNKGITEINHYDAEHDEINVRDVYRWRAATDDHSKVGDSSILEEIRFDRGWSRERLENELFERRVVLASLIENGLNAYADVAATVQAFMTDPDRVLALLANDRLEERLEDLREMESVLIEDDSKADELVSRPDPSPTTKRRSRTLLARADETIFEEYRTRGTKTTAKRPSKLVKQDAFAGTSSPRRERISRNWNGGSDRDTDQGDHRTTGASVLETSHNSGEGYR